MIGRNGSGKTTLLRHIVGLYLPTSGQCHTLGTPTAALGPEQLGRIGVVHQEDRFLHWMTVEQHLAYVGSFYTTWDRHLEQRLCEELEVDRHKKVAALSPGNAQKMAILLAVCHHPKLLLLDEPVSALDPIARERLLSFLLEFLREGEPTIVISSHVLRDVERIVDWVVCLDSGRLVENVSLDELQERFAEWRVTARGNNLPPSFDEPFIVSQDVNGVQARLLVEGADARLDEFTRRHEVEVESRPLNLEKIFPLLVERRSP